VAAANDENAVHPLSLHRGFHAIGDHFARNERVFHAFGSHRHAVGDGGNTEHLGVGAGRLDRHRGGVSERLKSRVAGRDRRVAVGNPDHRLAEVLASIAERPKHRSIGRTFDAFGDRARSQFLRHWLPSRGWLVGRSISGSLVILEIYLSYGIRSDYISMRPSWTCASSAISLPWPKNLDRKST